MIRIETTAEFDAEGRFTATGQTSSAVAPGSHRIVILVDERAATKPMPATVEPPLKWVDGLLVFTGEFLEDPEEVRRRLEDERMRELLGDLTE